MTFRVSRVLRSDAAAGLFVAAAALAVYLATRGPSIGYWDSAELATAGSTLGIAHPTGYPLFTLLSRVFVLLPTGLAPYGNLNLMAALLTACAVYLFFRVFLLVPSGAARPIFSRSAALSETPAGGRLAAATAALMLAFSRVFWSEALSLEVYALHLVFFAGVTLLFLRALEKPGSARRWTLFAYVLGLSFAHHMMTVLLAPAFLYLFFAVHGIGRAAWGRIGAAIPAFALGLTPYLYLPVRASVRPPVNWGDPATFGSFWTHVSAAQYRDRMFASAGLAGDKLLDFFRDLPAELGYAPLPLAALGLWTLFRRRGRLAAFTLLLCAAGVFYAVNYDFDDPNFRLHAHATIALWAGFGIGAVARWGHARGAGARWAVRIACAALVLVPFDANYRAVDQSADHAVEDYARGILESVEPGALILSNDLEGFVAGSRYLQLAEGLRPDAAVVGLGILAYPWYFAELEAGRPGLLRGTEAEREAYVPLRRDVERGAPESDAYNLAYTRVVRALLRENVGRRPVYASFVPGEFLRGYRVVPQGLLLRVSGDSSLSAEPGPWMPPRPIPQNLAYAPKVAAGYAAGFFNHAAHRLARGEVGAAVPYLRGTLELDPSNAQAREMLESVVGR